MRYRKAVFIVAYRKEKNKILYLLLKRKLHWTGWEFPKGAIKKNEPIIKALKREIKEETGQKTERIKKHNFSGRYKYEKQYKDRPGFTGQTYTLYSAEIKTKKIKLDRKEHSAYKWLSYKQALLLLTWKNQKKSLRIANKKITKSKLS